MNEKLSTILTDLLSNDIETLKANNDIRNTYNTAIAAINGKINDNTNKLVEIVDSADIFSIRDLKLNAESEYNILESDNKKLNAKKYALKVKDSIAVKNIRYTLNEVNKKIVIALNQVYNGKSIGKATFETIRNTTNSVLAETGFSIWIRKGTYDAEMLELCVYCENDYTIECTNCYYNAFDYNGKFDISEKISTLNIAESDLIVPIAEIDSKTDSMIQDYNAIAEKVKALNDDIKAFGNKYNKYFADITINDLI